MISDINSLKRFYDEIYKPYLQSKDNAFLYCIAARKKYLKENDECKLSTRADIRERKTIDKDDFLAFKTRLSNLCNNTYLDMNGRAIPDYTKVLYVQLNPVNLKSTYCEYLKSVMEFNTEVINSMGKPLTSHTMTNLWYTAMQTNHGNRIWFYFDLDLNEGTDKDSFKAELKEGFKQKFPQAVMHLITTRGGFHLIVKKENMSKDFNPEVILTYLKGYDEFCSEIKICKSNFIPCPGTIQGGVRVGFE